ncbi:DUF255 domain-containing protein [Pedobacter psychrodurus]|uniref:DUF255 domain-containing protein n=1 Tax=Pedobacter psychrodurus TaxID=2530456 RepID=A0A4R0Q0Z9_9SPHI|nr:thioredoxin family protein [Pedobacter psychrodurus]TCD25466.1 DUF255 domain-containing protein [Pedobacter psychrodurus]
MQFIKIFKPLTLILLLSAITLSSTAQEKIITAEKMLQQASVKAKKQKKDILIEFYASFNPWSKILRESLDDPEIKRILEKHYIICPMQIKEISLATRKRETPGGVEIFERFDNFVDTSYYRETRKVPTLISLDAVLKKTGQYTGFPATDKETQNFVDMLRLTLEEKAVVKAKMMATYRELGPPNAKDIMERAMEEAKRDHKKIFLSFTASWCHWCHVLDTAINHPLCQKIFKDKYVFVHLLAHEDDLEIHKQQLGASELLERYQGRNRRGIPFSVIFDENGKYLADFNGFPSTNSKYAAEYSVFEEMLKKTGGITNEELKIIKQAFSLASP